MSTAHLLSSTPRWLLDVTLQTTLLLALAGGVTICLPRLAAAQRHFMQASALLLIPGGVACSFMAPAWRGAMVGAADGTNGGRGTEGDDKG
jgi:hypothetical protein